MRKLPLRDVQSLSTPKPGQVKPRRLVSLTLIEADRVVIAGQHPKNQVVDTLLGQMLLEQAQQFRAEAAAAVLR